MANYKVVDADKLDSDLKGLADKLRAKTNTEEEIAFPEGFETALDNVGEDLDTEITEQEALIAELKETLANKASGGSGGGSASGGGFIEVSEFPTENVDENVAYKVVNGKVNPMVYLFNPSMTIGGYKQPVTARYTFTELALAFNPSALDVCEIYFASDFPTEPKTVKFDTTYSGAYIYIINDIPYFCMEQEGTSQWVKLSQMSSGLTDVGYLENVADLKEGEVCYTFEETAIGTPTHDSYSYRNGKWVSKANRWKSFIDLYDIEELAADDLDGCSRIGPNAFYGKINIYYITLPTSVRKICNSSFAVCSAIRTVTILGNITDIHGKAFYSCENINTIDFSHQTVVPTLENTNAFYKVPSSCQIIIPDALYDEWIAATNWSGLSVTYVKASEVSA